MLLNNYRADPDRIRSFPFISIRNLKLSKSNLRMVDFSVI